MPEWILFVLLLLIAVAVNYVAISEALGMSASVLAAGVAADNVICAIYFMVLFALASKIPAEAAAAQTAGTVFSFSLRPVWLMDGLLTSVWFFLSNSESVF